MTGAVYPGGWDEALRVLEVLMAEGLDPARVIMSHCSHGGAIDPVRDRKVASIGAWISYDSFTVTNTSAVTHYAHPDERRAEAVKEMLDAGFKHRILLSSVLAGGHAPADIYLTRPEWYRDYWTDRIGRLIDASRRDRHLLPADRTLDVFFDRYMDDEPGTIATMKERQIGRASCRERV